MQHRRCETEAGKRKWDERTPASDAEGDALSEAVARHTNSMKQKTHIVTTVMVNMRIKMCLSLWLAADIAQDPHDTRPAFLLPAAQWGCDPVEKTLTNAKG